MITLRLFDNTDADYDTFVTIYNANRPENPRSVEQQKQIDESLSSEHYYRRMMVQLNDEIMGITEFGESRWSAERGHYYWHFKLQPAYIGKGYEAQVYDAIMYHLVERNPRQYFAVMRDDAIEQIKLLEAQGYHVAQSEQSSKLDMEIYDPTLFEEVIQRVHDMDVTVCSVADLQKSDDDWLTKLWDLHWAVLQDVPRSAEINREPLEDFKQRVTQSPMYHADTNFVAVRDDDYIGLTGFSINEDNPTLAETHLTGIIRDYRRKGIATALKVRALNTAKAKGVTHVETMNNEINPMLDLNRRLGFQLGPMWRYYVKHVEES